MTNNININILKKAFPHLDERRKKPIDIILKLTELHESIKDVTKTNGLEGCSDNTTSINTEALLKDIKSECPKPIRDKIDMILNLSKTKEFYKTYMNISNIAEQVNQANTNVSSPFDPIKNSLSAEQLDRINELSHILNHNPQTDLNETTN